MIAAALVWAPEELGGLSAGSGCDPGGPDTGVEGCPVLWPGLMSVLASSAVGAEGVEGCPGATLTQGPAAPAAGPAAVATARPQTGHVVGAFPPTVSPGPYRHWCPGGHAKVSGTHASRCGKKCEGRGVEAMVEVPLPAFNGKTALGTPHEKREKWAAPRGGRVP